MAAKCALATFPLAGTKGLAIAWLLCYLQTQNTWIFVCYRLVFGVAILGAIAAGFLKNS